MGPDLGGTDGAFEDAGDLGEREFLEAGEEEHFALAVIEPGERAVKQRVVVLPRRSFSCVRRVVGLLLELGGIGGAG